jgi:TonB family protein
MPARSDIHSIIGMEYIETTNGIGGENGMSERAAVLATLLITLIFLGGCQTTSSSSSPSDESVSSPRATEAYRAYARGDYIGAELWTNPSAIEDLPFGEARHSLLLIYGFCLEQEGKVDAAIETYRSLIRDAPLSFASDDARERLRILRLLERDQDYEGWIEAARDRASQTTGNNGSRAPIERPPADFPPLARIAGIEGFAVVEFGVTPRGDTDGPVIVDSRPPLLFDGAAIRAVREWRYTRGRADAENPRLAIRLVFKLEDDEVAPPASVSDNAGSEGGPAPENSDTAQP